MLHLSSLLERYRYTIIYRIGGRYKDFALYRNNR